MSRAQWEEAQRTGRRCGAEHGEGRWHVTCDLPPGHELPHEAWRGYGTVVYQTWPWTPARPSRRPDEPCAGAGTGPLAKPAGVDAGVDRGG